MLGARGWLHMSAPCRRSSLMVIQTYEVTRESDDLRVIISLEDKGVATMFLEGTIHTECHGRRYKHKIKMNVAHTSALGGDDMNDLEDAIRGKQEAAAALAWRTADRVLRKQGDPCRG